MLILSVKSLFYFLETLQKKGGGVQNVDNMLIAKITITGNF